RCRRREAAVRLPASKMTTKACRRSRSRRMVHPSVITMDAIRYSRFSDRWSPAYAAPVDHANKETIMPGLKLTVSGQPDAALSAGLGGELNRVTCGTLGKLPERTMVMVRYVPHEHWFIQARSLAEQGKNSFRLEVTITEDTNTKDEKAIYQKEAYELLARL